MDACEQALALIPNMKWLLPTSNILAWLPDLADEREGGRTVGVERQFSGQTLIARCQRERERERES